MKQRNCLKDVDLKGVSLGCKEGAVNLALKIHCQKLGAVVLQLVHTPKE